jgi:hypothetical protein
MAEISLVLKIMMASGAAYIFRPLFTLPLISLKSATNSQPKLVFLPRIPRANSTFTSLQLGLHGLKAEARGFQEARENQSQPHGI